MAYRTIQRAMGRCNGTRNSMFIRRQYGRIPESIQHPPYSYACTRRGIWKGNTGYSISRNPSALYRGREYPRRKASARYSQRRCALVFLQYRDTTARGLPLNLSKCALWWPTAHQKNNGNSTRGNHVPIGTVLHTEQHFLRHVNSIGGLIATVCSMEISHVAFQLLRKFYSQNLVMRLRHKFSEAFISTIKGW